MRLSGCIRIRRGCSASSSRETHCEGEGQGRVEVAFIHRGHGKDIATSDTQSKRCRRGDGRTASRVFLARSSTSSITLHNWRFAEIGWEDERYKQIWG